MMTPGMAAGERVSRVAVVFNPTSGQGPPGRRERAVRAALSRTGAHVTWLETSAEDPGTAAAARAVRAGAEVVIVSGGDGTVMACATALAGTGVPMAVLPGGTGNLFAANLGIPVDVGRAVDVAVAGARRRIDVGVQGGTRFLIMAGIGFDAAMLAGADRALKRRYGWLAYVRSALAELRYPQDWFTLVLDGGAPLRRRASCVLVANLGRIQGGVQVVRGARPDDGLLDVAIIRARSLTDWLQVVARVMANGRWGDVRVETFRARTVEVRSKLSHPIEYDGDLAPPLDRLLVEVDPAALIVCVPRHEGR
jgi:YegS/Rv2252/BmrU family lipid kinase